MSTRLHIIVRVFLSTKFYHDHCSNHQIIGDKKALDFPLVVDFLLKLISGHYLANLPLSHIFSSNHRVLHFSPSPKAASSRTLSPYVSTPKKMFCENWTLMITQRAVCFLKRWLSSNLLHPVIWFTCKSCSKLWSASQFKHAKGNYGAEHNYFILSAPRAQHLSLSLCERFSLSRRSPFFVT